MPERLASVVIDTGALLAIIAATGSTELLTRLYSRVVVPWEVEQELLAGGPSGFGAREFLESVSIERRSQPTAIEPFLVNALDSGEAAVVSMALVEKIPLVCIDEAAGRRVARLSGLRLTGSLGILLRGKKEGLVPSLRAATQRMIAQGIWVSPELIARVLTEAGE
jgi:predicted nucleic acid-binding protein